MEVKIGSENHLDLLSIETKNLNDRVSEGGILMN